MTLLPGPDEGSTEVVVTDVEMLSADQLRPGRSLSLPAQFVRATRPAPELSRFFYRAVGGDWYWLERLEWTRDQWLDWVNTPGHELWSCWVEGTPAGYVELLPGVNGDVELAHFGLLPDFAGIGLGAWLLTAAVTRAWVIPGITRVWLHTSTLDSPFAMANYLARGFQECGRVTEWWDLATPSPGPWRGAR
jgi:GNAT superfamily N-acetyltransferase